MASTWMIGTNLHTWQVVVQEKSPAAHKATTLEKVGALTCGSRYRLGVANPRKLRNRRRLSSVRR
ncbi:hypothetical protein E0I74_34770 [Rhizobium laguerreae]|nr:hypothetical protein [Rhizobium laguerreae]NKM20936.1 hypothetical protein [Rhizobium laguerreae]NKM34386.1 hypothetical protein [Rhizobium laguerreae]NKM39099.1 hypothetical protein [Rhizobium laguerreae]NKN08488.1 hypothetical protein [Rhizobium laguerreae]